MIETWILAGERTSMRSDEIARPPFEIASAATCDVGLEFRGGPGGI